MKTPQIQVGARFGRLTVLSNFLPAGTNKRRLLCRCECGTEKEFDAHNIMIGHTLSCGCLHKERTSKANTTHGGTRTRLYYIFNGMHTRCKSHPDYAGKGLKVCPEWSNFAAFQKWALANGYTADREIDRRDNSKGYSPDNCRWATDKEQQRNRGVVTYYVCFGDSKLLQEWVEDPRCPVCYGTLRDRIRSGWDVHRAITTPARPLHSRKPKGGDAT